MGALDAPQDRHRDIHKTGPPERNRQTEAKVEQGAQEAKAGGPSWPWPRPSARPLQLGPLYPPKKIHGAAQGYQEPSGAKHSKHDTMLKRPWVTVWSIYGHGRLACQYGKRPAARP